MAVIFGEDMCDQSAQGCSVAKTDIRFNDVLQGEIDHSSDLRLGGTRLPARRCDYRASSSTLCRKDSFLASRLLSTLFRCPRGLPFELASVRTVARPKSLGQSICATP